MALAILPSDGFINRLLQQAHHSAPSALSGSSRAAAQQDQMSISNEARQATQSTSNNNLESKLMELYNQEGKNAS